MKKRNEGITLIALVITIIVLLILAGVAISMLSGENGLLNQAARAKTETEQRSMEEQINVAVLSAMANDKHSIDYDRLNTELKGLGYTGDKIESLPADIEINGNHYAISKEGKAKYAEWYYDKDGNVTNGKGTTLEIGATIDYDATKDENGGGVTESYTSKEKDEDGNYINRK